MTHRFIPVTDVVVKENRQRQEHPLEHHLDLVESIRSGGLLMAPVLRMEDGVPVLVAGERRLRALKDIYELGGTFTYDSSPVPPGMMPYTLLSELGALAAEEAELDENIRRVDLTWQERCDAIARLESIRTRQAAEGAPAPTLESITREIISASPATPIAALGAAYAGAKTEVIVSRHLHLPEVRAAKNVTEAMKVLEKRERKEKREQLSAIVGNTFHAGMHTALNGNCVDELAKLPPRSFDVILSDPPYGMGADEFGDSGGRQSQQGHFYDDSYEYWLTLMEDVLFELDRVAKPDAHIYLFCDFDNFHKLKSMLEVSDWKVFRTPLIFHKPSGARTPWIDKGPQRKYECILFAVRGDKKVTKIYGDVLTHRPDANMDHMAQKPVELYKDLLTRSALPGERVLDFCAGSGPIFPAAHDLKCIATGIEIDPASYAMCLERLRKLDA